MLNKVYVCMKSSNYQRLHSVKRKAGEIRVIEDSFYQFCTIGRLRERKLNSARERSETPFVAKMFLKLLRKDLFLLFTIS